MLTSETHAAHVLAIRDGLPGSHEWTERDLAVLELAHRQALDLDLLERDIAEVGVRLDSGRLNPALGEARQQRVALGRLLGLIAIPGEPSTRSQHASKAARARWKLEAV